MTTYTLTAPAERRPIISSAFRRVLLWCSLWSERRSLATLDPILLADIGVDALDAAREAQRPVWDIPQNRR